MPQHMLPRAHGGQGVTVLQIYAGKAQIDGGLVPGYIHGGKQARGFVLVGGLEAGAFAGGFLDGVKLAATVATVDQTVTGLHGIHRNHEN